MAKIKKKTLTKIEKKADGPQNLDAWAVKHAETAKWAAKWAAEALRGRGNIKNNVKKKKTLTKVFTLTRYNGGQHFRSDAEFNAVYFGDKRYTRVSFDGGWTDLHNLVERVGEGRPLGSKVRVTIEVV